MISKKPPKISAEEYNNLDPITKFSKYNKFPAHMLIHFLIVIFTTLQVILFISSTNIYSRANEQFIYNMLISPDQAQREKFLFTPKEVREHVINSLENFYDLETRSLELTNFTDYPYVIMEVSYLNFGMNSVQYESLFHNHSLFTLSKTDLGPLSPSNDTELKTFLNKISSFKLNYSLKTYNPNEYFNKYDCFLWKINQIYSFRSRAHISVSLTISKQTCKDSFRSWNIFLTKLLWVHLTVFFLAFLSLQSTWKYIDNVANLFIRVRTKNKIISDHDPESDNSIYYNPLIDQEQDEDRESVQLLMKKMENNNKKKKMKFNKWSLMCLVGNIIQLFASAIAIFDFNHNNVMTEILIGFGCFFAYLYIGRYIEYAKNYSTIYVTIKKSLPNVCRYLIGVTPIFLGFIFFGVSVFWKSDKFKSISDVMIVLFSLANGDSVYDIFQDVSKFYFFIGQIYLYLFCILFITVVLNIFIAIVQEAYTSSQDEFEQNSEETEKKEEAKEEEKEVKKEEIDLNFENIIQEIEVIKNIIKEISSQTNEKVFEDIREGVFEYINEDMVQKIKEIKEKLKENNK